VCEQRDWATSNERHMRMCRDTEAAAVDRMRPVVDAAVAWEESGCNEPEEDTLRIALRAYQQQLPRTHASGNSDHAGGGGNLTSASPSPGAIPEPSAQSCGTCAEFTPNDDGVGDHGVCGQCGETTHRSAVSCDDYANAEPAQSCGTCRYWLRDGPETGHCGIGDPEPTHERDGSACTAWQAPEPPASPEPASPLPTLSHWSDAHGEHLAIQGGYGEVGVATFDKQYAELVAGIVRVCNAQSAAEPKQVGGFDVAVDEARAQRNAPPAGVPEYETKCEQCDRPAVGLTLDHVPLCQRHAPPAGVPDGFRELARALVAWSLEDDTDEEPTPCSVELGSALTEPLMKWLCLVSDGVATAEPAAMGVCPRCGETLHAVVSEDGSAWEADACQSCGATWMYSPPRQPPAEWLSGVRRAERCEAAEKDRDKYKAACHELTDERDCALSRIEANLRLHAGAQAELRQRAERAEAELAEARACAVADVRELYAEIRRVEAERDEAVERVTQLEEIRHQYELEAHAELEQQLAQPDTPPAGVPDESALVEALAALEHERWSGWEKYRETKHGDADNLRRWKRQRETAYADLTE